jgi:Permuted papain-like amidase enzyme, YaeF/YiiX, C92 family
MLRLINFLLILTIHGDGREPTDRLVPPGWAGNPWGPAASRAREAGEIPPIELTPAMRQWDRWGRAVLREGDIVFRLGDARILYGYFPFSRFTANVSGSRYSHTGIVAVEDGVPVVYDMTKDGVRRQPFCIWILDNVGPMGVKRLRSDLQTAIPAAIAYCRRVYQEQVPFDFELAPDDRALYCVEMTEKAFRTAGVPLSESVRLGAMEHAAEFPICMFAFEHLTSLRLDQPVYFPGNERHGVWSSPSLVAVWPPAPPPVNADGRSRPSSRIAHRSGE